MVRHKKVVFWLEESTSTRWQLYFVASKVVDPQHLHFAVNKSVRRKTRNVVHKEILLTGEVVSTQTEVPLSCSLQNSDQPRGEIDL